MSAALYHWNLSAPLCEWHGYSHVTRMYLWIARILRLQPMRKIETKQNWVCQAKVTKLLDLWSQSCQSQNSTPTWSVLRGVVMNYDIDSMLFVWYSQVPQQGAGNLTTLPWTVWNGHESHKMSWHQLLVGLIWTVMTWSKLPTCGVGKIDSLLSHCFVSPWYP